MNTQYVKIEMLKHNMTNKDIANTLNINVNTISRWINNKNVNNIELFLKLINLLELDTKKLLE